MKRSIILLASALMLMPLCAIGQNKVDKQGLRQGHWMRTDKDGSKIYEGNFVDGQETGVFTYYYHDGTVRVRNTYIVPGRLCRHEAFDEEGHLMATGYYNQRNRDSLWVFYAPDGRRVKEASYRMGVKEGLHVVFNHDGDTSELTTWRNNHRNGRWWRRVGEKGYITANYRDGGVEGRLVEYDENGLLVREGSYENGFREGEFRYYENKVLTVVEKWSNGMLTDRKVRMLTPDEDFVSVFDIVCLAPKGKNKVVYYLNDGSRHETAEGADDVYDRLGTEIFVFANRKSRIMVARRSVEGLAKDAEGRDIVKLSIDLDFSIFPDEDGLKMVSSRMFDDHPALKEYRD